MADVVADVMWVFIFIIINHWRYYYLLGTIIIIIISIT